MVNQCCFYKRRELFGLIFDQIVEKCGVETFFEVFANKDCEGQHVIHFTREPINYRKLGGSEENANEFEVLIQKTLQQCIQFAQSMGERGSAWQQMFYDLSTSELADHSSVIDVTEDSDTLFFSTATSFCIEQQEFENLISDNDFSTGAGL